MRGRCARRAFSRAASSKSMLWWCVYLSAKGAPDAASADCTSSANNTLCHTSVNASSAVYMHSPSATTLPAFGDFSELSLLTCLAYHVLQCLSQYLV